ncbi:MAG: hypothetical protein V1789_09115 [PVC group bacterium]
MKTGLFRIGNLIEAGLAGRKSAAKLKKLQSEKLRKLLSHACRFVPLYRRRFNELGLRPDEFRDPADLVKLPTLSKEELRDTPLIETMAENVSRADCVEVTTSGSTGRPLRMYYTRKDFSRLNMNWLRPLFAHGVKPWYKKLEISGPHNLPPGKKWYQHLGLMRSRGISIFRPPGEWVDAWRSGRPDFLYGYSGSLKLLARYVLETGVDDIRPRFVFGVSDLVDEECRELIPAAFSRPMIDLYGAAETGCIAWECPGCRGYHLNMDTVLVEYLRDGRPAPPGTPGRLVVTNLHSFAMPIIRYELEDIGTASELNPVCGRGLPLMKIIEGRSDAFIVLPSGEVLSPMFFFGLMKTIAGIRHWKVMQSESGRLEIAIVPAREFSSDTVKQIKQRVQDKSGEKMEIRIKVGQCIPPDSSGKVRAVVSQVKKKMGKDRQGESIIPQYSFDA